MTSDKLLVVIYDDLQHMNAKIDVIADDVSSLKDDVAILKSEVAVLKDEVHILNIRVSHLEKDNISIHTKLNHLTQLNEFALDEIQRVHGILEVHKADRKVHCM